MARRLAPLLALVLLLGAGLAFALLGMRSLRLEAWEAERRAQEHAREAAQRVAAQATGRARAPADPPEATWTLSAPLPDATRTLSEHHGLLLAEATYLDRTRDDPEAAAAVLAPLIADPGPAGMLARLRRGALLRRLGRAQAARVDLERVAEDAPIGLADETGLPLRLLALHHLAGMDLEAGEDRHVGAFLEASGAGKSLFEGQEPGPGDLVEALAAAHAPPRSSAGPRLTAAAARAAEGRRTLHALRDRDVAVVDGAVARRDDDRIERRPLAGLIPPGEPVRVVSLAEAGAHAGAVGLAAPLEGAALVPAPRAPEAGHGPLVALLLGLAVYAAGAVLAVVALRRSARTQRMQADFVAAVSHELKTPITSVRTMAELLADGAAHDPARSRDYATRIGREMERLGRTVRNVLDASRIERAALALHATPQDPAALVQAVAGAARPEIEHRGMRLDVAAAPPEAPVALDREAIEGVLWNLLENATKYAREGGEVRIEAGPSPEGRRYRIAVLDRGPGVPPEERARLFERFQRGAQARVGALPGVGIGLHVARQVARAHGGDLRHEPREGGGSAFVLDVPA